MKTIKIESSFWVGDIVYGIVAEHGGTKNYHILLANSSLQKS